MRIWLDNENPMPKDFTVRCKNVHEVIWLIKKGENIEKISFAHDLGDELTGTDLAKYIEHMANLGEVGKMQWEIHSGSPEGEKSISEAMQRAERLWNRDHD